MMKRGQPGRDCTLEELLAEPMIQALMRSDGVLPRDVRAVVAKLKAARQAAAQKADAPRLAA